MSDASRTVEMFLIKPGNLNDKGEFVFEMEPRFNAGRTVTFALTAVDAESLRNALDAYLQVQR